MINALKIIGVGLGLFSLDLVRTLLFSTGNPAIGDCKPCNCLMAGSLSSQCDPKTGQVRLRLLLDPINTSVIFSALVNLITLEDIVISVPRAMEMWNLAVPLVPAIPEALSPWNVRKTKMPEIV